MIVQEPVQAAIWHCLNHYAYQDAIFLAERLCTEVDTDETLFLLATCYYRCGKPGQAYSLLKSKPSKSPQCRYLLARCCYDLNRFREAETAILGNTTLGEKIDLKDLIPEYGDLACFVIQLLAKMCTLTERVPFALIANQTVLDINPFLWSSFESLCDCGSKAIADDVFQVSHLENFNMCHGTNTVVNLVNSQNGENVAPVNSTAKETANVMYSTPMQKPSGLSIPLPVGIAKLTPDITAAVSNASTATQIQSSNNSLASSTRSSRGKSVKYVSVFNKSVPLESCTPSFGVLPLDTSQSGEPTQLTFAFLTPPFLSRPAPVASSSHKNLTRRNKAVFSQSCHTSNSVNIVSTPSNQPPSAFQPGFNVRRSSRLFSSNNSVKENSKSVNHSKLVVSKSPSRKCKTRVTRSNLNQNTFQELNEKNKTEKGNHTPEIVAPLDARLSQVYPSSVENLTQQAVAMQKQSVEGLMSLLRDMGTAYKYLANYNSRKAIQCFEKLPAHHAQSGWVLCHLAKAYFELSDYEEACRHFASVREREPYRLELMEYYSTALWHLQKDVALSALSQMLVQQDKLSPATWCATGNCFSLQKEHDTAIKFFQRAVQVDPNFPYAYTLLGHEYVSNEELDKAMSAFRNATRIDERHYNAWYGVGMINYKQEKYSQAEVYFRKAFTINPQSTVLMCHIGVVLHGLRRTDEALQMLNAAIATDPRNPLCRFQRASIYFSIERHQEALKELNELKEIVPKESLVYFLIGKVHNKLGNTDLALMYFSWAMDLDPKGANTHIKEAIDPAISRTPAENNAPLNASEEFPSEDSTLPVQESPSQESLVFPPNHQGLDSDGSI